MLGLVVVAGSWLRRRALPRPPPPHTRTRTHAIADLAVASPSLGLDALYAVLGLILGFNAYNERALLATRKRAREAAEAAAAPAGERERP